MARVTIERHWPEGEALVITVTVAESYPDAVAEARVNAKQAFAEAMALDISFGQLDGEGDQ